MFSLRYALAFPVAKWRGGQVEMEKKEKVACRFGTFEGGAGYMQVGKRYPNDDSASHDLSLGT
jgi:hypothetical protein